MELLLQRDQSDSVCTLGTLFVDGTFECYTLEDVVRDHKVYGQTAIPAGRYKIVLVQSYHFNRIVPMLQDVPNYDRIYIHSGNRASDTLGCILVGHVKGKDEILQSHIAFDPLFVKIQKAYMNAEEIWITVKDA
jgi:hypothetical protein